MISLALLVVLPLEAWSQDRWYQIAEIRRDMTAIFNEIKELQSVLGAAATDPKAISSTSGSIPRRVDALETELRENIAKLEELEYKIRMIAEDGANRIAKLESKIVALEGGDASILAESSTLGGVGQSVRNGSIGANSNFIPPSIELTEMDKALLAYSANDFRSAAELFHKITGSYPRRDIASKAFYYRGESLVRMDQWKDAASAYLDSYSVWPNGEFAPKALFGLGASLGKIDRVEVACATLQELGSLFPAADETALAEAEMNSLNCN